MLNSFTKPRLIEIADYPVSELGTTQQGFIFAHQGHSYFVRTKTGDYLVSAEPPEYYPHKINYRIYRRENAGLIKVLSLMVYGHPMDKGVSEINVSGMDIKDVHNTCFKKFVGIDPYFADVLPRPPASQEDYEHAYPARKRKKLSDFILAQRIHSQIRKL